MPYDPTGATNALRGMIQTPGSYQGSPGFQFAYDRGLQATQRADATSRGSGNALADLVNTGTGLAAQDYNQNLQTLGGISAQQQGASVAQQGADTQAQQVADQYKLGAGGLANQRYQTDVNYGLGVGGLANQRYQTNVNYDLGLGGLENQRTQIGNNFQNDWWQAQLGQGRNANDAANIANTYNLGAGRNAIDWYNAGTNRGSAAANIGANNTRNDQNWWNTLNPGHP